MARAPFASRDVVDFIVVGSGAAGGIMAKELSSAGHSVVLLEQGPIYRRLTSSMTSGASITIST